MSGDERNSSREFQDLNRVLEAEKAAQAKMVAAEAEVESLLLSAQDEAREIAARADRRIQALHVRFLKMLEQKKARICEEFLQEKEAHGAPLASEKIKELAHSFAADLVGVLPK